MCSKFDTAVAITALTTAILGATIASAQDTRRELGAHQHGQGTLDVAIEGNKLTLEFRAPGDDIVGFEGKAKTAKAKQALAAALAILEKPLALFILPDAAQCTVVSAKAKVGAEDDHAHGHSHGKPKPANTPATKHDNAKSEHSEFHADYVLTCAQPTLATSIDFGYFKLFPKAEKVGVQIIAPKGQTSAQATPAKPRVEFGALVK
jgi:hypothetical protein